MTLRLFLVAASILALSVAGVAGAASSSSPPASETTTSSSGRIPQTQRKTERTRPGAPLKPRMIEAPGAAVMMIPASYDPMQLSPFSPF